jgi:hypothetical protein
MGELAPTLGSYLLEQCLFELIINEEMLNLNSKTLIYPTDGMISLMFRNNPTKIRVLSFYQCWWVFTFMKSLWFWF